MANQGEKIKPAAGVAYYVRKLLTDFYVEEGSIQAHTLPAIVQVWRKPKERQGLLK